MSAEREARIRKARQAQPTAELERKALKAVTRSRIWQAEEIDLAKRRGAEMSAMLAQIQWDDEL